MGCNRISVALLTQFPETISPSGFLKLNDFDEIIVSNIFLKLLGPTGGPPKVTVEMVALVCALK